MNATIIDTMKYSGKVQLSLKIADRIVKIQGHNEGTMQLKRAFAMFMCGGKTSTEALKYIPSKLDLRYFTGGTWQTYLKRTVPISSPSYGKDTSSSEQTWFVEYASSIPFSSLISTIPDTGSFRLYLMCDRKENNDDSTDLAYIDIAATDLQSLEAGVSAIVSWRLSLLNNISQ